MNITLHHSDQSGPWACASTHPPGPSRLWDVAVWAAYHQSVILVVRFDDGGNLSIQGTAEQVIERFVRVAVALDIGVSHVDVRAAIDAGFGALLGRTNELGRTA